jgi:hypothetical protein
MKSAKVAEKKKWNQQAAELRQLAESREIALAELNEDNFSVEDQPNRWQAHSQFDASRLQQIICFKSTEIFMRLTMAARSCAKSRTLLLFLFGIQYIFEAFGLLFRLSRFHLLTSTGRA